jgi:hypothetical protein
MWPFRRKPPNISELPPIDDESGFWSLSLDDPDTPTLIVRKNKSANRWFRNPLLATRVTLGLQVTFNQEDGGQPTGTDVFDEFEDVAREVMTDLTRGIHVLSMTSGNRKTLTFYVMDELLENAVLSRLQQFGEKSLRCSIEPDPLWNSYSEL